MNIRIVRTTANPGDFLRATATLYHIYAVKKTKYSEFNNIATAKTRPTSGPPAAAREEATIRPKNIIRGMMTTLYFIWAMLSVRNKFKTGTHAIQPLEVFVFLAINCRQSA